MDTQEALNKIAELEAQMVKVQDEKFGTKEGHDQLTALSEAIGDLETLIISDEVEDKPNPQEWEIIIGEWDYVRTAYIYAEKVSKLGRSSILADGVKINFCDNVHVKSK